MDKYIVVFKSGAKQEFYSTSVKTKSNGLTGQLVEIEFNRDGKIRPLYINLSNVSGIFVEKNMGEEQEAKQALEVAE
jgi:hypothetical protein